MVSVARPYGLWRDWVMKRAGQPQVSRLLWKSLAPVSFQIPIVCSDHVSFQARAAGSRFATFPQHLLISLIMSLSLILVAQSSNTERCSNRPSSVHPAHSPAMDVRFPSSTEKTSPHRML
ncbi:L-alanine exporter AlaE [Pseudomonas veronii]|uniref:L-alanine exporter AlaE n=1 Tax=Pseudomonas veronii TaxID=76761 RepID=UPI002D78358D|nr:L-alanine exporter AlaE [Pseudomonas veronii]WRU64849.1 L-alanine exporter AlaE [Pseudomonas veronii]